MYSSYGRTGGCASCGVAPRDISSTQYSNNYYSNYNRYENNNNYVNKYSLDNNRFENSYSNGLRKRIMTPTKNYTSSHLNTNDNDSDYSYSRNNYRSYYSPQRTTGCRECAANSAQQRNRNYQRPFSGNNFDRYNMNRALFRDKENNDRYRNLEDNYDNKYRFNRYRSPEYNVRRNLYNTRYDNEEENNTTRNYLNKNKLNFSVNNNKNSINSNLRSNNYHSPNKLYNSTQFNNYKTFLESNINKYNYNRNLLYRNRDRNEERKSNYEIPNERFIDLNQYNYQKKLKELLDERKTFFVYVHGSNDYTGKSWCSDCNIAKPLVEQGKNLIKIKKDEKEVYFLSIPIDKIYMEDFRDDPYIQLERVPTLILFENGYEKGRLIENDLFSYLTIRKFILRAYEEERSGQYIYERRNYY